MIQLIPLQTIYKMVTFNIKAKRGYPAMENPFFTEISNSNYSKQIRISKFKSIKHKLDC